MARGNVAVDPVTIVIKECISLSTSMRKYAKYSVQSGVAALLGGGSDIFINQDASLAGAFNNLAANKTRDPLLSGLIQLRLMLNHKDSLEDVDALTVLQPFLLVISTASTSGYITSLALDSLQKFFAFNIINESSKNHIAAYRQTINSLTHCKFEGSEHLSDDSVLLKVLVLIESIIASPSGQILSDSCVYDVLQTVMSLACNKRRTDVLRKAAEMSMLAITVKLFDRLKKLNSSKQQIYINDQDISKNVLKDDNIGAEGTSDIDSVENGTFTESSEAQKLEADYGLPVIKDYMDILVSLLLPENQHKQNNSTKVFGLHLLNTAIELAGDRFPQHPQLFSLVCDPICKNILYIIQNSDKLSLLQAALQLFTNLTIILGDQLSLQIEFTINTIFSILLDRAVSEDSKPRPAAVKELLIEQISILWTRSPSFFTSIFINFDCNLERSDLAIEFLKALTSLSLPESALTTSDSVPPICLEGLISVIDDMHDHFLKSDMQEFVKEEIDTLNKRKMKTDFIECAEEFNRKPKKGIPVLIEKGFIPSNSEEDIAKFLFDNNARLNKKTIGEYLAAPEKVSLLAKFIASFDFSGLRIDEAIRTLLTKFRLPGESQQIERVVEQFSAKYVEDQHYDPEKYGLEIEGDYSTIQPDADSVFVLSYSVIILNTDFYNPQVKKHMSFEDYILNLRGCNNQKDFPLWYLDRVYCSIRDKEIVMPEEHHGSERWFDDSWNNLIAATTVVTESHEISKSEGYVQSLSPVQLIQFDKTIFESVGSSIIETLFKIFEIASDDHIATRMLTTLDKCSKLASLFGLGEIYNNIITTMVKFTTLTGERKPTDDVYVDEIPVVQIDVEDSKESIVVSNAAIMLGNDFKAQLSTVVLFRILRQNGDISLITESTWNKLIDILLVLYENMLISPDIFPDLQDRLKLPNLPKCKPEVLITKPNSNRGLLSTFASYLKGDEEPTDEEIQASTKAMECIKTGNIAASLFGNDKNVNGTLINSLLGHIKREVNDDNKRFFDSELLFLLELSVSLYLFCKDDTKTGKTILNTLSSICKDVSLPKNLAVRIISYRLLMISILEDPEYLLELINEQLLTQNEIFDDSVFKSQAGSNILQRVLSLAEVPIFQGALLHNQGFWKLLRKYTALGAPSKQIYVFLDTVLLKKNNLIDDVNFMWVLGLFDEMSSIGAVGSQWEEKYNNLVKTGHKVDQENPYQEIVELSLKSINLTSHLLETKPTISKSEIVAIIQAFSHQCLNPCFQIRSYALSSLENLLLKLLEPFVGEVISVISLIDMGLYPLTNELDVDSKNAVSLQDFLQLLSKLYLHYLSSGKADNDTYLKVLSLFNKHVDNEEVEGQLQDMITKKREIEKKEGTSSPVTEPLPEESTQESS
ncbi:unnamed protein product [Kluyveromyces dobzhanskii CBS 2104]|uniref:WGS project CCBQ000000000 data, contig 00006 n=1 Tax=Kluyveromyces dobzhanskii CBS 2104 TaxID=1427455 RepID=A0A0A8LAH2_9SACH|nr:unnamed protein product [Kluyveromyces dobzhanskii CBS 2104]